MTAPPWANPPKLSPPADDLVILTSYVNGQAQILAAILDKLGDEVQAAGGAK
jgi:hypothetical protein